MPLPPPLVNQDSAAATPGITPPAISPKPYKGVTVDSKLMPFDVLTTHIAGSAWDVDYYSQDLRGGMAPRSLNLDSAAVYQPYRLMRGMELKVTSALSEGQDSRGKENTLQGAANTYPVFIPVEGDFFKADIGDGREGIFEVTSSKRLSHYESSPYAIEYSLIYMMDDTIAEAISRKTTETTYFKHDWMRNGLQPMLHEEEVDIINKLTEHNMRLISLYFNDFYSRDFNTLLVPNQPRVTYDPFLVRYMKTMLGSDEHPLIRRLTEFNVSEKQAMYEFTIWSCLEALDYALLPMAMHEAGIVDVGHFFSKPLYNSVYYSGVQAVIYPDMDETNVDAGYSARPVQALGQLTRGRARFNELHRLVKSTLLNEDPTVGIYEPLGDERQPSIRRVTKDSYYVFTREFYNHSNDVILSKLEALTLALLKGEAIDIRVLEKLCDGARFWDNVERFYYVPVLLTLLRNYQRRIK